MNIDFTNEVSTFNKDKFKILAPGKQFWDGLTSKEKEGKVLVVPKYKKFVNGNINYQKYEDLVIEKKDKNGNGIDGIQFCIAKDPKDITQGCDENYPYENWITKDGKLEIPTNELPLYNQTLIEIPSMQKTYKPIKIDIYVDPGNRFLGEVAGKNEQGKEGFITYNELLSKITGIPEADIEKMEKEVTIDMWTPLVYHRKILGKDVEVNLNKVLSKGNDTSTGGNWLKIYDAREGKILYIAKKPLTTYVSWNQLCLAGVVFGLDQVNADGTLNPHFKTPPDCGEIYKPTIIEKNGKRYIVRLLRGTSRPDPNNMGLTYSQYLNGEDLTKSEWNRYILPITKYYRYGYSSSYKTNGYDRYKTYVGEELAKDKDGNIFKPSEEDSKNEAYTPNKGWKTELASYNWFGDLTLGTYSSLQPYKYLGEDGKIFGDYGQNSWVQDSINNRYLLFLRGIRGLHDTNSGAAMAYFNNPNLGYNNCGFRPVLEETH